MGAMLGLLARPSLYIGVGLLVLAYKYLAKILALVVRELIMHLDRTLLGVDIEIDMIMLYPLNWRCEIFNMKVLNPEGYKGEYMLNAARITLDLNATKFIMSLGKDVEVEELNAREVDAIVEFKGLIYGESNLHNLLSHIGEIAEGKKEVNSSNQPREIPPILMRLFWAFLRFMRTRREISLKKVVIEDVGAKAKTKIAGVRVACADIKYDDFSKEKKVKQTGLIVLAVLECIAKSVLASVTGKRFADWAM